MPQLENTRHELYAKHRARGFSSAKSAMAAGYASGSSTSAELEKDPKVIARIEELLTEINDKRDSQRAAAMEAAKVVGQMTGYSRGWVIQKLAENAQLASAADDFKSANEALKLIGQEFGMFEGGSGGGAEEGEDGRQRIDMGALTALMDQGSGETAGMIDVTPPEPAPLDDATLSLIEGQGKNKRRRPTDRKLTTGSETDVALTEESEPDETPAGWQKIDPKTSPEDLVAHIMGEKVLPAYEEVEGSEVVDSFEAQEALQDAEDRAAKLDRLAADHPPIVHDSEGDYPDDTPPRRSRSRRQ